MRGIKKLRLEEYITAQNATEDYSTGDLVRTAGTAFNFWGKIEDKKSNTTVLDGKRLDNHQLAIICRTRDVDAVTNGTELTLDSNTFTYQVEDKFDYDFKFHSMIIASAISN